MQALARIIVLSTKAWFTFEEVVGFNNTPFLALAAVLAAATGEAREGAAPRCPADMCGCGHVVHQVSVCVD